VIGRGRSRVSSEGFFYFFYFLKKNKERGKRKKWSEVQGKEGSGIPFNWISASN
jgi:hypothetical protein